MGDIITRPGFMRRALLRAGGASSASPQQPGFNSGLHSISWQIPSHRSLRSEVGRLEWSVSNRWKSERLMAAN